jgi:hypothetical protein
MSDSRKGRSHAKLGQPPQLIEEWLSDHPELLDIAFLIGVPKSKLDKATKLASKMALELGIPEDRVTNHVPYCVREKTLYVSVKPPPAAR